MVALNGLFIFNGEQLLHIIPPVIYVFLYLRSRSDLPVQNICTDRETGNLPDPFGNIFRLIISPFPLPFFVERNRNDEVYMFK